jgi:hypothetical protein
MIDESEITRQIPLVADAATRRTLRCPEPAKLAAYVGTELDARPRSKVEEHLADCAYCLGQVGFLVRESRATEAPPLPASLISAARERPTRRFSLLPGPALTAAVGAAALFLVVAVLWQSNSGSKPFSPAQSGFDSATQSSSGAPADRSLRNGVVTSAPPQIVSPGDGEIVARLPVEVRWLTSPEALQYAVQLLSLEGDLVWEGLTAGESAVIPSEIQLEPGQKYYVWVEAQLRSGGTARSTAVAFRVAPE